MANIDKGRNKWGNNSQDDIQDMRQKEEVKGGRRGKPQVEIYRPGSGPLRKSAQGEEESTSNDNVRKYKSSIENSPSGVYNNFKQDCKRPDHSLSQEQLNRGSKSYDPNEIVTSQNTKDTEKIADRLASLQLTPPSSSNRNRRNSLGNISTVSSKPAVGEIKKKKKPDQAIYISKPVAQAFAEKEVGNKSSVGIVDVKLVDENSVSDNHLNSYKDPRYQHLLESEKWNRDMEFKSVDNCVPEVKLTRSELMSRNGPYSQGDTVKRTRSQGSRRGGRGEKECLDKDSGNCMHKVNSEGPIVEDDEKLYTSQQDLRNMRYSGNRRNQQSEGDSRCLDENNGPSWRAESPNTMRRGESLSNREIRQASEPRVFPPNIPLDMNRTRDTRSVEPVSNNGRSWTNEKLQAKPPSGRRGSCKDGNNMGPNKSNSKSQHPTFLPPRFKKKYYAEAGLSPSGAGYDDTWDGSSVTFTGSGGVNYQPQTQMIPSQHHPPPPPPPPPASQQIPVTTLSPPFNHHPHLQHQVHSQSMYQLQPLAEAPPPQIWAHTLPSGSRCRGRGRLRPEEIEMDRVIANAACFSRSLTPDRLSAVSPGLKDVRSPTPPQYENAVCENNELQTQNTPSVSPPPPPLPPPSQTLVNVQENEVQDNIKVDKTFQAKDQPSTDQKQKSLILEQNHSSCETLKQEETVHDMITSKENTEPLSTVSDVQDVCNSLSPKILDWSEEVEQCERLEAEGRLNNEIMTRSSSLASLQQEVVLSQPPREDHRRRAKRKKKRERSKTQDRSLSRERNLREQSQEHSQVFGRDRDRILRGSSRERTNRGHSRERLERGQLKEPLNHSLGREVPNRVQNRDLALRNHSRERLSDVRNREHLNHGPVRDIRDLPLNRERSNRGPSRDGLNRPPSRDRQSRPISRERVRGPSPRSNRGPSPRSNRGISPRSNRCPSPRLNRGPSPRPNRGLSPRSNRCPSPRSNRGHSPRSNRGPSPRGNRGSSRDRSHRTQSRERVNRGPSRDRSKRGQSRGTSQERNRSRERNRHRRRKHDDDRDRGRKREEQSWSERWKNVKREELELNHRWKEEPERNDKSSRHDEIDRWRDNKYDAMKERTASWREESKTSLRRDDRDRGERREFRREEVENDRRKEDRGDRRRELERDKGKESSPKTGGILVLPPQDNTNTLYQQQQLHSPGPGAYQPIDSTDHSNLHGHHRQLYDHNNPQKPIIVTTPGSRVGRAGRENDSTGVVTQNTVLNAGHSTNYAYSSYPLQSHYSECSDPNVNPDHFGNNRPTWYNQYSSSFQSAHNKELILETQQADMELQWIIASGDILLKWDDIVYIRRVLQEKMCQFLVMEIKFCQAENVDNYLWKIMFYNIIELLRKGVTEDTENKEQFKKMMVSVIDEGTEFFEKLLAILEQTYKFKLDTYLSPNSMSTKGLGFVGIALIAAQKIFLNLGDLARYKAQVMESENFGKSRLWYIKAHQINPKNGRPYNQLAILATYARRKLDAVYYYMRSFMASNPFQTARESLVLLFDESRKKYEQAERKRREERETRRRERMKEKEVTGREGLRREYWVHPEGGRRLHITTAAAQELRHPDAEEEELATLTSVDVNRRFITSYLNVHGKLFTKIGMETFQEAALQMLREFRALLQHTPVPLPVNRFLHLLALNMFAIENTQLKESQLEPGYRSALQESALVVSLQMFSLILEKCIVLLREQLDAIEEAARPARPPASDGEPSSTGGDGVNSLNDGAAPGVQRAPVRVLMSESLDALLPAVKVWCDWLLCHGSVWNPPPSCADYRVGPPGDAWSRLATLVNLLERLDVPKDILLSTPEEGSELVRLPEDATLCDFTPLMSNPQENRYCRKDAEMEIAQESLRIHEIVFFGTVFLCGIDPPVLKLQKHEHGGSEYVSVVQSSNQGSPSGCNEDQSDTELLVESFSEDEVEEGGRRGSAVAPPPAGERGPGNTLDPYAAAVVESAPSETLSLLHRREELKQHHQQQEHHRQRVQAILRESVISVEIEVRPRYLVPDTNCFIDYLTPLKKLSQAGLPSGHYFTLMVPLVVFKELEGLARGANRLEPTSAPPASSSGGGLPSSTAVAAPSVPPAALSVAATMPTLSGLSPAAAAALANNPEHVARVAEAARSALLFLGTKQPGVRCVTSRGTVMPACTFMEEETDQDERNDDRILATCVSLCQTGDRDQNKPGEPRRLYREVVLLTEDRNLRVKALARDIPVREVPDFLQWAGLG